MTFLQNPRGQHCDSFTGVLHKPLTASFVYTDTSNTIGPAGSRDQKGGGCLYHSLDLMECPFCSKPPPSWQPSMSTRIRAGAIFLSVGYLASEPKETSRLCAFFFGLRWKMPQPVFYFGAAIPASLSPLDS